ncbi:fructokinase [Veronia pacifica]|uniref:Fructokinase n=1 Tax=Veronia pacifica TaxID=1080227 RepID=A0A1C3EIN8_9GAMM|nr:fructokinase [Veronia pacifica]ODA33100.1 fructokinase [Veronia pacifica]
MKIGIDLGGTKIEIVVLDDSGEDIYRKRVPTPKGDYLATLNVISALIDEAEKSVSATCTVGIGIPGVLSPKTGLVKNANSVWLIGKPMDKDLERLIGRPVRIANDANCFTVSESVDGSAMGLPMVFGVILGTGCGGGIVLNNYIHPGLNLVSGEWGHNPLPWQNEGDIKHADAFPCYCGKRGCIETFISGTGFERDFTLITGQELKGEAIMQLAEQGDKQALASVSRYQQRLAKAIASVVNIIDPDIVVLGGGISKAELIYDGLNHQVSQWVFGNECETPIKKAKFGDSSGVRGAAWLW